jgi:hypothetical protein
MPVSDNIRPELAVGLMKTVMIKSVAISCQPDSHFYYNYEADSTPIPPVRDKGTWV